MTNVEALKNLYVALGGSADEVAALDSNAAIINLFGNVAGGGGGGLVVNASISGSNLVLDKTFAEIESAVKAGSPAVVVADLGVVQSAQAVVEVARASGTFTVKTSTGTTFTADSADGYPSSSAG